MTKLQRVRDIYGPGNPIPVGKTNFYGNFVLRDEHDPYIPGTKVKRLRLHNISEKVRIGFEDEIEALVEALRAARDGKLTNCNGGAKVAGNESQREGAA